MSSHPSSETNQLDERWLTDCRGLRAPIGKTVSPKASTWIRSTSKSAAGITTDVTSTTGIKLRFCRPRAGNNLRRDHRYGTTPEKPVRDRAVRHRGRDYVGSYSGRRLKPTPKMRCLAWGSIEPSSKPNVNDFCVEPTGHRNSWAMALPGDVGQILIRSASIRPSGRPAGRPEARF